METFRPAPPPLWQRISSNGSVLAALVVALIVLGATYVLQRDPSDETRQSDNRVRFLIKSSSSQEVAEPASLTLQEAALETSSLDADKVHTESLSSVEKSPVALSSAATEAAMEPGANGSAKDQSLEGGSKNPEDNPSKLDGNTDVSNLEKQFLGTGLKLNVIFTEMSQVKIRNWIQLSQARFPDKFQESAQGLLLGALPRTEKAVPGADLKILQTQTGTLSSKSPVFQFFSGAKHRSGDIQLDQGLFIYTSLSQDLSSNFVFSADLQKNLRVDESLLQDGAQLISTWDGSLQWFVVIPLPKNIQAPPQNYTGMPKWFELFRSSQFLADRSVLVLLFQLENNNAL